MLPLYSHTHPISNPTTTTLFFISIIMLFCDYINRIMQHISFWDQLFFFPLSKLLLNLSKLFNFFASIVHCFLLFLFHGMDVPQFVKPLKGTWVLSSFWLLQIQLLLTFMHKFSSLGYMPGNATVRSYCKSIFSLKWKCQTSFQSGCTTNAGMTQFLHNLTSIWCYFSHFEWYAVIPHYGFNLHFSNV